MTSGSGDSVIVVGGALYGVTTAIELARRGHAPTIIDTGPLPHPRASSTDISKAVRADYDDPFYAELAERAWIGWQRWNREWPNPPLRESGVLLLAGGSLDESTWEGRVYASLKTRGYPIERLCSAAMRKRFPAFSPRQDVDGYVNARAGWVPSSAVIRQLLTEAVAAGVVIRSACVSRIDADDRGVDVSIDGAATLRADRAVVCAGAWTGLLVPEAATLLRPIAQPVLHFRVEEPERFMPPMFPVWAVDLTGAGWYGFPALPDGTLKVGNHGPGTPVDPAHPGDVTADEEAACRAFLARMIPEVADAPRIGGRRCLYSDGPDGDFLIDRVPGRHRVTVAAGGSGHAFKFAPILGAMVADVALEGDPHGRFAWRNPSTAARK